jgi:ankyrin repeat protein
MTMNNRFAYVLFCILLTTITMSNGSSKQIQQANLTLFAVFVPDENLSDVQNLAAVLEGVKKALAAGADVNAVDSNGYTALQHASAEEGYEDVVALLLASGANVDFVKGRHTSTPLYYASANGQDVSVDLLLAAGANVDVRDSSRSTPLHRAAGMGHFNVFKKLLIAGANTKLKNDLNYTVWDMAEEGGQGGAEILKLKGQIDQFFKSPTQAFAVVDTYTPAKKEEYLKIFLASAVMAESRPLVTQVIERYPRLNLKQFALDLARKKGIHVITNMLMSLSATGQERIKRAYPGNGNGKRGN